MQIPISQIVLPKTLSRLVDKESVEYLEIADSVRDRGIYKPILVRLRGDEYEVVDGLHRLSAAIDANHQTVPCEVRNLTDDEAIAISLEANAVSKPMLTCEYANLLKRYLKHHPDLSMAGISKAIHKSPQWVSNCLSLTNLTEEMQAKVNRGEIPVQSAYLLAKIPRHQHSQFVPFAQSMNVAEFKELATGTIRIWKESVRSGRLNHHYPEEFKIRSWLRSLREIREEHETSSVGVEILMRQQCSSPLDGWRAAIEWMLHLDSNSVEAQRKRFEQSQRSDITRA